MIREYIIYKLSCNETGKYIINYCKCSIQQELIYHISAYMKGISPYKKYAESFPIIDNMNFKISILETYTYDHDLSIKDNFKSLNAILNKYK
jgi:hypothetical protein